MRTRSRLSRASNLRGPSRGRSADVLVVKSAQTLPTHPIPTDIGAGLRTGLRIVLVSPWPRMARMSMSSNAWSADADWGDVPCSLSFSSSATATACGASAVAALSIPDLILCSGSSRPPCLVWDPGQLVLSADRRLELHLDTLSLVAHVVASQWNSSWF